MSNNTSPVAHRQNHLDFLYELYTTGIEIGEENIRILKEGGMIKDKEMKNIPLPALDTDKLVLGDFDIASQESISRSDREKVVDSMVDIIMEGGGDNSTVTEEEHADQDMLFSGKMGVITKKDWKPASITKHTPEFVKWINSINFQGFQNQTQYKPFLLYVQQMEMWTAENDSAANYDSLEEREEYEDRELRRYDENSLYFLNRQLRLKEGDMVSGSRTYRGTKGHQVILFMLDCGYSFYLGKPRQIAASSTIGGWAAKKLVFSPNLFMKFVTESGEKGDEIFEDKIKYAFSQFDSWIKPDVLNDRGRLLALGYKEKKGDREGVNSKLQVVAPSKTAIAGGSPQVSLVDEAGNIPILTQIIEDANPTMYWMNPDTGEIELKRQMVIWGTGGDMEKGGKAFEREFMAAIERWLDGDFSSGIIPLFFDWTTRPGINKEFFEQKKKEYYSKVGPDAEKSRVTFHQQYPETIADMFLSNSKTLVSQEYINGGLERIRKYFSQVDPLAMPQYGYLEPVYGDVAQPDNSDIPFNIIGVNFVGLDVTDPRVAVTIFQHPKRNWINRYYQGTDPIASDAGQSKMSSSVWDVYYHTISAVVNFRSPNYKEVYLQSMLLGIYYDTQAVKGIKELTEANLGLAYREYKDNRGYFDTLVFNSELPINFQTQSGNLVGLDNRGFRNKLIIDKMFELIQCFGHKIYLEEFFVQLKTFVCTFTPKGNETWGPIDKRYYWDDILFSATFAYICALCYSHLEPKCLEEERRHTTVKMISTYDKDWNLIRVPVRVAV